MKLIKYLGLAAVIFAAAITAQATTTVLINGYTYTTTNVPVGGTNLQNGVVWAAGTNIYNLPAIGNVNAQSVTQTQGNTNQWPSAAWSLTGYPNTLYGPNNNEGLYVIANETATNASAVTLTIKYAGSDGYYWFSNYFIQTVTIPTSANNVTSISQWTNIQTGALPFMAVQEIDNPSTSTITNLYISETGKPGL